MDPVGIVLLTGVVGGVMAAGVLASRQRRARARIAAGSLRGESGAESAGDRLRRGLAATRRKLGDQIDGALGRGIDRSAGLFVGMEDALVAADMGVPVARAVVTRVQARLRPGGQAADVRRELRAYLEAMLDGGPPVVPNCRPWVVLVTGVNGVGKTTTIGKLAAFHAKAGRRVLMVAGDTFRAAAIEQLGVWAERSGAVLVRQAPGASPAAVAFDGVKAAIARNIDVVLIDTAGRLHTDANLMEELRKVRRVVEREIAGAPHETLLVLDATTGQNAVSQARAFASVVGVTGIVLTKLDGTARGGIAFAVRHEAGAPIRFIGIGEDVEDLRVFNAREFVDALLEC